MTHTTPCFFYFRGVHLECQLAHASLFMRIQDFTERFQAVRIRDLIFGICHYRKVYEAPVSSREPFRSQDEYY